LTIGDKAIYEGPAIAVPRVGEDIQHDGQIVRVESLLWDFTSADRVSVTLSVGTQPYTY
jgi:hypothetical protein